MGVGRADGGVVPSAKWVGQNSRHLDREYHLRKEIGYFNVDVLSRCVWLAI